MEIASAGLSTYGNSFEESLGMITAGTEIYVGRSSQIARALMTVSARIHNNSDAIDALEKLQIPTEDQNGVRSTYQILNDVAAAWGDLSDSERIFTQQALAGTTRGKELAAVMNNWSHAVEATETAMNSQGSAMKENEAYMGSIESKITAVKGSFQELSNDVIDSDLVTGLLDLADAFLRLADTDIGQFATQVTTLSTGLSGIYGMISAGILSGLDLPALGTVAPYILVAVAAVTALNEGLELLGEYLQQKADAKIFDNIADEISESEEKIKEYNTLIESSKDKLSELEQIPWGDRTTEINFEIAQLESLIKAYEELREEEERNLREKELKRLRGTEFESGFTVSADKGELVKMEQYFEGFTNVYEKAINGYYNTLEDAAIDFGKVMDQPLDQFTDIAEMVDVISDVLATNGIVFQKNFHSWSEELQLNTEEMSSYINQVADLDSLNNETVASTQELIDKNQKYYDTLRIVKKYGGELSAEEATFLAQYESLNGVLSQVTVGTEKLAAAKEAVNAADQTAHHEGTVLQLQDYVAVLNELEGIDSSNIANVLAYLQSIGAINLDYTASDLEEIVTQLDGLDDKQVAIDVSIDTETDDLEELEEKTEAVDDKTINITSQTDAAEVIELLNQIKELATELSNLTVTIQVKVNAPNVISTLNNISSAARNILTYVYISINAGGNALSVIGDIQKGLDNLKDKEIKVTTIRSTEYETDGGRATGSDYFGGGNVLINDGAPINGSAAELIVADGKASIYNGGDPTVVNLPKGAKIYTAAETQEILKNVKDLKESIPSFANGNVTVPASINAGNIKYTPSSYYKAYTPSIAKNDADAFEAYVKERKHLLELDKITEEQYYLDLEKMNETYLKNNKDAQDKYWQYQEEVYKWKKQQLEEENKLLEKQIELEKALGELAKVKSQKILVFRNGRFQYMADIDAISEAQKNIEQIKSGYASGTESATAGLHLVGENGPELRVLNSGDGIIPNNLTKNLLDMAKMSTDGLSNAFNKTKEVLYSFNISNLTLPNVKNAEDFLDGLKSYAYQYSYG